MSALAAYWPWPDLQLAWPLALLALPLPILMYAWKRRADPGAALRVPYAAAELEALAGGGRIGFPGCAAACCGWPGWRCAWRWRGRSNWARRSPRRRKAGR